VRVLAAGAIGCAFAQNIWWLIGLRFVLGIGIRGGLSGVGNHHERIRRQGAEFGPNSTTFVYPSEIFPVRVRTTGHGIAAAMGKLGGFLGVFLFPYLLNWKGMLSAESAATIASALGLVVALTMLPETKGKSLEAI
jgi:MFS family permease